MKTSHFKRIFIDELLSMRVEARQTRNWNLADRIREFLDSKKVYVFDTPEGQVAYHCTAASRQELIDRIKLEVRADRLFQEWLGRYTNISAV